MVHRRHIERDEARRATGQQEPPWYGTVCPVVWEDGGGDPASYPMLSSGNKACMARKNMSLVPSYHYLPYGYTCYTFPNVKYVTYLCVISILAINYNLL